MRVTLLGVRGSTPAPGRDFVRYGGHTSCVAVSGDGDGAVPRLVLDAGTGVRNLPQVLGGAPFAGAVVLTHLHWDHVQGLPFSPVLDHPEARVDLWVPVGGARAPGLRRRARDLAARRALERFLSPPAFPIDTAGLRGHWWVRGAVDGALPVAGADVVVATVAHKGGLTHGVRVDVDGATLAYLPDHLLVEVTAPDAGRAAVARRRAEELVRGVDLLLHDGQFLPAERAVARDYGHATLDAVLALADRCEVGRLVLTHHAPARTDDALDRLAGELVTTPGGRSVAFARQDDVLVVQPRAALTP